MFFCVFGKKTPANISTGRGNKSFCSKGKKNKKKKEKKENTRLKLNHICAKKGTKGESLKKKWEKLEFDRLSNSIKQDKTLASNGDFNLSKLEGRLQGW